MYHSSDLAHGRFLGGAKLLEKARWLGARLPPDPIGCHSPTLIALERWGSLVPVLRYREPLGLGLLKWRRHQKVMTAKEMASPLWRGLLDLRHRLTYWNCALPTGPLEDPPLNEFGIPLHPYDSPDGPVTWLEDPLLFPLEQDTYARRVVGTLPGGGHGYDGEACVALYRGWQALLLYELTQGGTLVLHRPGWQTGLDLHRVLQGQQPAQEVEDLSDLLSWGHRHEVEGFDRHRQALEALNWFETYQHYAFQAAPHQDLDRGQFVVSGEAYRTLLLLEGRLAWRSLQRNRIDIRHVLRMIAWATRRAIEQRRQGRPRVEDAYTTLAAGGVRLLQSLNMNFHAIAKVTDGRLLDGELRRLFPDWLAEQRFKVETCLEHAILPNLERNLAGILPTPDAVTTRRFVGWLEEQGMLLVFWHFDTLQGMEQQDDPTADAAAHREVLGMSATLEHILNALDARGTGLHQKLVNLWTAAGMEGVGAELNAPRWKRLGKADPRPFHDNMAFIAATLPDPGCPYLYGELLRSRLIRNEAQHGSLKFLRRRELADLFLILFRTAFLSWYAWEISQSPTPGSA